MVDCKDDTRGKGRGKIVAVLVLVMILLTAAFSGGFSWLLAKTPDNSEVFQLKKQLDSLDEKVKYLEVINQLTDFEDDAKVTQEDLITLRKRREIVSNQAATLDALLNRLQSSNGGVAGPPGSPGLPGRDGRDAVNLATVDQHINVTVARFAKNEMEKVRLAARELPVVNGAVYTRWGRNVCPDKSMLVYQGVAGGTMFHFAGGSSEYICLPDDPEYLKYSTPKIIGRIAGVEYATPSELPGNLQDHNGPCAVCQASNRATHIMLPAKVRCPDSSWTLEYQGYLMGETTLYSDHKRMGYVCVDKDATALSGMSANVNGALWYHQIVDCPTFGHCPPYHSDRQLACVVCSQ